MINLDYKLITIRGYMCPDVILKLAKRGNALQVLCNFSNMSRIAVYSDEADEINEVLTDYGYTCRVHNAHNVYHPIRLC